MKTHVVFVLDRSGSMQGRESDVIGSFNSFLREQKSLPSADNMVITTVLFDNEYEILHDGQFISYVKPLTEEDYYVRGSTALLDAIGRTINRVKSNVKEEDKVLFFINTDGEENSSVEYSTNKIKRLISQHDESPRWKFVFLGADIDAFSEGRNIGVTITYQYQNNSRGISDAYGGMTAMATSFVNASDVELASSSWTGEDTFKNFVDEDDEDTYKSDLTN